jgi:formylglycine-generating enzyme required for sulfatase activity
MSNENEMGIRAIQERLAELDDQRGTLEQELENLVSGEPSSDREPLSGTDRDPDGEIVNGVYLGERPESREEQIKVYRSVVAARTRDLPLRGFDPSVGTRRGTSALSLARLYVCLDTDLRASESAIAAALKGARRGQFEAFPPPPSPEQCIGGATEGTRPMRAMEAAILRRCQVLLGAPGTGKTTFVNYLANALAAGDEKRLAGWPAAERHYLPFLLSLRELAAWIGAYGRGQKAGAALIWGFLVHDLRERNLGFVTDVLREALEQGEILLLMDGFDEVPPEVLPVVRDSIQHCVNTYPNGRYIVTCRVSAYNLPQWRLPEKRFPRTGLVPFEDHQIDRFADAWYSEVSGGGHIAGVLAGERAERLKRAVRRSDLRSLASNPMLLTVMALLHTFRGELPEARARLYEEALHILLFHWEQGGDGSEARLTDLLREAGRDRADLILLFERLAFEVCPRAGQASAAGYDESHLYGGLGEQDLVAALRELHPQKHLDWAQDVADLIKLRAGLLVEVQPGAVCFLHRTFQEYLAGAYLAHFVDFPERVASLVENWTIWRDTILFAVGFLVHNQRETERPLALVERLCPPRTPENDHLWRGVWLAGDLLLEIGLGRTRDSERGSRLVDQVRHRLTALIELGALDARERAEAGDVLGRLGDARFDHTRYRLPAHFRGEREKSIGLVPIKPASLSMGSREGDPEAGSAELGSSARLSIDYRFWIARYPVTVAQFNAFLKAGGYEGEDWWTKRGWSWRRSHGREEPWGWDLQRAFANRPVVGVTWFEAVAYAGWLDAQLRRRTSHIPPDYRMRLPTEAEWERVARGAAGRRYAWGDEWDDGRANVAGVVDHACAVGMFPGGGTPSQAMDLTGNVWEWCLTRFKPYPYRADDGRNDPEAEGHRVLRGGSWLQDRRCARCSFRLESLPDGDGADIGFRLVLSRSEGS